MVWGLVRLVCVEDLGVVDSPDVCVVKFLKITLWRGGCRLFHMSRGKLFGRLSHQLMSQVR